MNPTTDTSKLPNPSDEVRRDLWLTMGLSQLHHQRDLIIEKISKMNSIMNRTDTGTFNTIYVALQQGLNEITDLIDNRISGKSN